MSDPNLDYDSAALCQKSADIWRYICKQSHRGLGWDLASVIGPEVVVMHGDYRDFVTEVDGYEFENPHYKYANGFPTELLWATDWQAIVDKHIADAIEKFTVEQRGKNPEKIVRQTRQSDQELQTAIVEKTKAVLSDAEYQFLVKNLFSR